MSDKNKKAARLSEIQFDIPFSQLSKKMIQSQHSKILLQTARDTLVQMKNLWQPAAITQWFDFEWSESDTHGGDSRVSPPWVTRPLSLPWV